MENKYSCFDPVYGSAPGEPDVPKVLNDVVEELGEQVELKRWRYGPAQDPQSARARQQQGPSSWTIDAKSPRVGRHEDPLRSRAMQRAWGAESPNLYIYNVLHIIY